mmetsp:Transcript_33195/g.82167  ORF Transcript_33195/g.82167 Transcript_33195/m.82167 type:complete len:206 (+) Transcript_33195:1002-1619(+)
MFEDEIRSLTGEVQSLPREFERSVDCEQGGDTLDPLSSDPSCRVAFKQNPCCRGTTVHQCAASSASATKTIKRILTVYCEQNGGGGVSLGDFSDTFGGFSAGGDFGGFHNTSYSAGSFKGPINAFPQLPALATHPQQQRTCPTRPPPPLHIREGVASGHTAHTSRKGMCRALRTTRPCSRVICPPSPGSRTPASPKTTSRPLRTR